MDGSRFDGLARILATGQSRRQAIFGVASGALAGVLSLPADEQTAAAACIKLGRNGCEGLRNRQCCDGATCRGGSADREGRCLCKKNRKKCGGDCVNLKKDKRHCGRCDNRCVGPRTCKNGTCVSVLGCRAGENLCDEQFPANCPATDNPNCFCTTDVEGTPRCSAVFDSVCSDCTRNSDCPNGFVCAEFTGFCGCDTNPGSNGNGCTRATCDGINGG